MKERVRNMMSMAQVFIDRRDRVWEKRMYTFYLQHNATEHGSFYGQFDPHFLIVDEWACFEINLAVIHNAGKKRMKDAGLNIKHSHGNTTEFDLADPESVEKIEAMFNLIEEIWYAEDN